MAVRVRDFSRAHPSTDANYASVLGQLEERVSRMEELAKQQQGGIADGARLHGAPAGAYGGGCTTSCCGIW